MEASGNKHCHEVFSHPAPRESSRARLVFELAAKNLLQIERKNYKGGSDKIMRDFIARSIWWNNSVPGTRKRAGRGQDSKGLEKNAVEEQTKTKDGRRVKKATRGS